MQWGRLYYKHSPRTAPYIYSTWRWTAPIFIAYSWKWHADGLLFLWKLEEKKASEETASETKEHPAPSLASSGQSEDESRGASDDQRRSGDGSSASNADNMAAGASGSGSDGAEAQRARRPTSPGTLALMCDERDAIFAASASQKTGAASGASSRQRTTSEVYLQQERCVLAEFRDCLRNLTMFGKLKRKFQVNLAHYFWKIIFSSWRTIQGIRCWPSLYSSTDEVVRVLIWHSCEPMILNDLLFLRSSWIIHVLEWCPNPVLSSDLRSQVLFHGRQGRPSRQHHAQTSRSQRRRIVPGCACPRRPPSWAGPCSQRSPRIMGTDRNPSRDL